MLGRYEILFRIAAGGMAQVYAARAHGEAGFQKLVAVKRMLPSIAEDQSFVSMFLDEARVAANIASPHVVSTLDLGKADDDSPYLVMELVVGVTLARILRSSVRMAKPVPLDIAVELIAQAAQGLHDAHQATTLEGAPLHVVHRDVSPQNVLVGVDGRARIMDFGVARAVMRATQTDGGQIKGKYAYSSPEQLRGDALDRRSDIFGLGVVAWELFASRHLFRVEHPLEIMERVLHMPVPPIDRVRPDVPAEVARCVAWALARDPRERPDTARELAKALRAAAQPSLGTPGQDRIAEFVVEMGGDFLSDFRANIRTAVSAHPELKAMREPIEAPLTPRSSSRVVPLDGSVAVDRTEPNPPTPSLLAIPGPRPGGRRQLWGGVLAVALGVALAVGVATLWVGLRSDDHGSPLAAPAGDAPSGAEPQAAPNDSPRDRRPDDSEGPSVDSDDRGATTAAAGLGTDPGLDGLPDPDTDGSGAARDRAPPRRPRRPRTAGPSAAGGRATGAPSVNGRAAQVGRDPSAAAMTPSVAATMAPSSTSMANPTAMVTGFVGLDAFDRDVGGD